MSMQTQRSPNEFGANLRCPPDTVDDAHDFLAQVWVQRPDVTPDDRLVMETATSELVTNVVKENRHRLLTCNLTVTVAADLLVLEVSDDGEAVPEALPAVTMPAAEAESGRGLVLIRLIGDDLSYRRVDSRNVWRVEKLRTSKGP